MVICLSWNDMTKGVLPGGSWFQFRLRTIFWLSLNQEECDFATFHNTIFSQKHAQFFPHCVLVRANFHQIPNSFFQFAHYSVPIPNHQYLKWWNCTSKPRQIATYQGNVRTPLLCPLFSVLKAFFILFYLFIYLCLQCFDPFRRVLYKFNILLF